MAKGRKTGGRKKGTPNKSTAGIRDLAQEYTAEALETILEIMRSPNAPENTRLKAAKEVLDRGYGRPTNHITGTVTVAPENISDEELARMLLFNQALVEHERKQKGLPPLIDVIDVTPVSVDSE